MEQQQQLFSSLEKKLTDFVKRYQNLKEQRELWLQEKGKLNHKLAQAVLENRKLKDENERLKMVNALLGEKEHRRLMKIKLNRLIKEVDFCIAQMKN